MKVTGEMIDSFHEAMDHGTSARVNEEIKEAIVVILDAYREELLKPFEELLLKMHYPLHDGVEAHNECAWWARDLRAALEKAREP